MKAGSIEEGMSSIARNEVRKDGDKGKGKEKEVYANDEADGPVYDGANAWVGQKSVQREYDGDEEYHALYSQE